MLSTTDWTAIEADMAAIRGDNQVSLVLRRGATTLTAQDARIAGLGGVSAQPGGNHSGEARARVTILGAKTLNIQVDDRFTYGGTLYRVNIVHTNRRAKISAEAEMVE